MDVEGCQPMAFLVSAQWFKGRDGKDGLFQSDARLSRGYLSECGRRR